MGSSPIEVAAMEFATWPWRTEAYHYVVRLKWPWSVGVVVISFAFHAKDHGFETRTDYGVYRKIDMINYIGIDGEMSGTDIDSGHKLIQIGMAKYVDEKVVSIGVMLNPGVMEWSEQAEKVHQFSRDYVEKMGEDPAMVDQMLADWANKTSYRRDYVMVGFNVGSFDKPFIKQQLPITFGKFSRRCVDLNSVIFAMSDSHTQFEKIKAKSKEYAFEKMEGMFEGFANRQHDAEYDAVMSLYCFEYLRSIV